MPVEGQEAGRATVHFLTQEKRHHLIDDNQQSPISSPELKQVHWHRKALGQAPPSLPSPNASGSLFADELAGCAQTDLIIESGKKRRQILAAGLWRTCIPNIYNAIMNHHPHP